MTQISERSRIRKTLYQNLRRKYGLVPRELLDKLVPLRLEEKRLIVKFMSEHNEGEKPSLPDIKVPLVPKPPQEEIWLLKDNPKKPIEPKEETQESTEKDEALWTEFLPEAERTKPSEPQKGKCAVCGTSLQNPNLDLCRDCFGNYEFDRITRKYVKR